MTVSGDDSLLNFDVDLQQFYYDVIRKEVDIRRESYGLRRALKEVVDAYKKVTVTRNESSIRFDTSLKRCAYLLKHSPCFTSAVANYLLKLLCGNPQVIEEALSRGKLAICCLGGGPASDAVAVVRIVKDLYHRHWLLTRRKLRLKVSVVDISGDWLQTVRNVLQCLQRTPGIFGVEEMELSYEFIGADLTETMTPKVKWAIRSADVVTMVYFLSAVNGSRAKNKSPFMIKDIMLQMKKGAFLFFLDSAAEHHYQILNEAASCLPSMQEIYGPFVEEFHSISLASVSKFLDLYSEYFRRFVCMTNMFLCVSSWIKQKKIETLKTTQKTLSSPVKKPTEEESERLTERMIAYRETVQSLVDKKLPFRNMKPGGAAV